VGTGGCYPEDKVGGHVADQSPHLVLRLRMYGAIPPLPNMYSWHGMAWNLIKYGA